MFTLAVSAIDQKAIVFPYTWIHTWKRLENLAQSCLTTLVSRETFEFGANVRLHWNHDAL